MAEPGQRWLAGAADGEERTRARVALAITAKVAGQGELTAEERSDLIEYLKSL